MSPGSICWRRSASMPWSVWRRAGINRPFGNSTPSSSWSWPSRPTSSRSSLSSSKQRNPGRPRRRRASGWTVSSASTTTSGRRSPGAGRQRTVRQTAAQRRPRPYRSCPLPPRPTRHCPAPGWGVGMVLGPSGLLGRGARPSHGSAGPPEGSPGGARKGALRGGMAHGVRAITSRPRRSRKGLSRYDETG